MEGEEPETEAPQLFPTTVGEKLRAAREAKGMELADVAAATRIPQRHLEAIERGNYTSLPSSTYALGFAKAYARAVGADEVAIARELRGELSTATYDRIATVPSYEMEETRRGVPGGLVWACLAIAALIAIGAGLYYGTNLFRGSAPAPETLEIPTEPTPEPGNDAAAASDPAAGHVALTAIDTVWLRVTDGTGKVLYEKEMQPGERYDVPADADHPRARTARPDRVQVTLNGSNVAPLGEGVQTVEAEVSADAIAARGQPGAAPSAAATTPAATTARTTAQRPRPTRSTTSGVVQDVTPAPAPAPAPVNTPSGNATPTP